MSRLLRLKSFLTLGEAADYLAHVLEEDVGVSDVLQLALDGHLTLTVNIVNGTSARKARIVSLKDGTFNVWGEVDSAQPFLPPVLVRGVKFHEIDNLEPAIRKGLENQSLYLRPQGDLVSEDEYVEYEEPVFTIWGLHDLPMIGAERINIQQAYQEMTGGPDVTVMNLDGAFVVSKGGDLYHLQESFEENEYKSGSHAFGRSLEEELAKGSYTSEHAEAMRIKYSKEREAYLKNKASKPKHADFYAADSLPQDAPIVVRPQALNELLQNLLSQADSEADFHADSSEYVSDHLRIVNRAAKEFWSTADPDDANSQPKESEVIDWLKKQGMPQTTSKWVARIIRPSWAHSGRRPGP
ncbi:MAG: hypothetical protein LAT81_16590 [Oceanicaulis sp.]|nr:hypothetical protein [Oceanicaulis sp.]